MKKRLWPLPGGGEEYVITLKKCLAFIQETNPHQEQLKVWFFQTFPSVESERTVKDYLDFIENLGLIMILRNKFALTPGAREFLKTHDNNLVYQLLDAKYIGIHEILELLNKKPQALDEICLNLKEKIGEKWQTETQCLVRLNWLRSSGYVVKDGPTYRLTNEGRNIVESETEIEEKTPNHNELRDRIVEIGKRLGLFSKKEYPINDYFVDVAWKQNEATRNPFAVFEVHLKGNIFQALTKLKYARNNLGSEPFLYTTKKGMLRAQNLVNTAFPEIAHVIRILHWTEINELEESTRKYHEVMVNKMKLIPKVYRQTGRSQKRSSQNKKKTEEKE